MTLSPLDAQRMIRIVEETVDRRLSAAMPRTEWGVVSSFDAATATASVTLFADTNPSPEFIVPRHLGLLAGDVVRVVIEPRGQRYVEQVFPPNIATSNPVAKQITSVSGSTSISTYPVGWSMFYTSTGTLNGWPFDNITVTTVKTSVGTTRSFQQVVSTTGAMAVRAADTGGVNGWSPFIYLDSYLLPSDFAHATSGSVALGAGTNADLTVPVPTLTTPLTGNYRVWVAGFWSGSHSAAARVDIGVRITVGGTTSLVTFQRTDVTVGQDFGVSFFGWLDSASAGTDRATAFLVNNVSAFAEISVTASVAGTLTTYSDATAEYVTHIHMWVTRL